MLNQKTLMFDLQLFADGAGDAGTGTGVTGQAAAAEDASIAQSGTADRKGEGRSASDRVVATVNGEEDIATRFDQLINGEFKGEYSRRTSEIVQKRIGEAKMAQERLSKITPMLDILRDRYQVKDGDDEALFKALEADDSLFADEAAERGMTIEQLKEIKSIQRENKALKAMNADAQKQEQIRQDLERWMQDAEPVKKVYPSFDFAQEMENPDFFGLLKNGIPMQTAYEVIHKDEIIAGAMQYTAQQVAQKTVQGLASKAARPTENGISSPTANQVKFNIKGMTAKEREEYARRAQRGEKVTFK